MEILRQLYFQRSTLANILTVPNQPSTTGLHTSDLLIDIYMILQIFDDCSMNNVYLHFREIK